MTYNDIKHLVGLPWVYIENDCWAIFKQASAVIGREVHNLVLPDDSSVFENIKVFGDEMKSPKWVKVNSVFEGCAIVFFDRKDRPIHIGFALDSKTVLHSMGTNGSLSQSSCDKIDLLIKRGLYKRYESYDYNM